MYDLKHMHGCEFLNELSKHIDINLNGYLGDVVCGGGWMNPIYDDFVLIRYLYKISGTWR